MTGHLFRDFPESKDMLLKIIHILSNDLKKIKQQNRKEKVLFP